MNKKRVRIVYYSGTGGTAKAAECFAGALRRAGHEATTQQLKHDVVPEEGEYELLMLLFAVHAFNAPEAVYKWIESRCEVNGLPVAVISVSGGGEASPNTACRASTIRRLERKGYKVIYEKMLVMPSNWMVATKQPFAKMLLEVLPQKVQAIVEDIDKGVTRRTKPQLIDRFFSFIGEAEKHGARYFGKRIKVVGTCTGCGWCADNCPSGNITMKSGRPVFDGKCHFCLKCLYGCPTKALEPGMAKFIMIKEGYDLNRLEGLQSAKETADIGEMSKAQLSRGVREYLLDEDNSRL